MFVLGIDGGGTKTTGIVADEYGNVYMKAVTGRSNPNTLTKEEFEKVMSELLLQLKNQNSKIYNQLVVCFAGLAGVGESGRDEEVIRLLKRYLPSKTKVLVQNDAYNALYSGTLGSPGLVQIAGTGAITLGINERQNTFRSGGWGFLFDDEGSGFYFGNEALRAAFKAYDKRGPSTTLTSIVLEHFEVATIPDIINKVYGKEHPRSVIAPLAPMVVKAAEDNDDVAKEILTNACIAMINSIQACHNQLFDKHHPTTIVLSGGVFSNAQLFIKQLKMLSKEIIPNVSFQVTQVPPVGGAVVACFIANDVEIGDDFVRQLNEQINV